MKKQLLDRSLNIFILFLVLIIGASARFYNLNLMPLNLDEHCDTIQGTELIKRGNVDKFLNIPISIYKGKIPLLFNFFSLVTSRFFIDPVLIARIPSVLFGTLTIFLVYLLGRILYGDRVGLFSSLFLAFLPWHIIMSRIGLKIIMVPFFGVFIFYLLYSGVELNNRALFLLSFFALGVGAFYTYPSALIFIPIFMAALFLLKNRKFHIDFKLILTGIFLFLIPIFPMLALSGRANFLGSQSYHSFFNNIDINGANFFQLFYNNFILNIRTIFQLLFFCNFPPMGLFAPSMGYPLLLSKAFFILFLVSAIYAFCKHKASDLIMLTWVTLGILLTALIVKDGIQPRYLFVILPAPLILIAAFLKEKLISSKIKFLKISAYIILVLVVSHAIRIYFDYHRTAPKDKEEWMVNSAGSKEAAEYLFKDNLSRNYTVVADFRMTVSAYLSYYIKLFKSKKEIFGDIHKHFYEMPGLYCLKRDELEKIEKEGAGEHKTIYYFLWSGQTHNKKGDWRDYFTLLRENFKALHPDIEPIRRIYYPDGSAAIEIFKIVAG